MENFVLRGDWQEAIVAMDDADAGMLLKAIYQYNATGEDPLDLSPMAKLVFLMARPFFDDNAEKYRRVCERNRKNGSSGGRPTEKDDEEENPKNPVGFLGNEEKPKKPSGYKSNVNTKVNTNDNFDITHSNECESARTCAREDAHTPSPDIEGYILPQNVKMTAQEIKGLASRYPDQWREMIDHLSEVMLRNKKTYPDHYRTILRWAKEDGISPGRKGEYYDSGQIAKSYDVDDFFEAAVNKARKAVAT